MTIADKIYLCLDITKNGGVPFLLVSNPGYGKTTSINAYAEKNGYAVESVIGSRFTPEEVSGYQVNEPGKDTLVHKNPVWYNRIIENEKKGVPSILFVDEISTCNEAVQGALLSLIFDRSIGYGKKLPDDCLIISAANYAPNLPDYMNIIAPTLNRFCIINLLEDINPIDIVSAFVRENTDADVKLNRKKLANKQKIVFENNYLTAWANAITSFSSNSKGLFDIKNQSFDGIYQQAQDDKITQGHIMNFVSGRTISYLKRTCLSLAELYGGASSIDDEHTYDTFLFYLIEGLVGLGTNQFVEKEQLDNYISTLKSGIKAAISAALRTKADAETSAGAFEYNKDISITKNISNLLGCIESLKETNIAPKINTVVAVIAAYFETTVVEGVEITEELKATYEAALNLWSWINSKGVILSQMEKESYGKMTDYISILKNLLNSESPLPVAILGDTLSVPLRIQYLNPRGELISSYAVRYLSSGRIRYTVVGKNDSVIRASKGGLIDSSKVKSILTNVDGKLTFQSC